MNATGAVAECEGAVLLAHTNGGSWESGVGVGEGDGLGLDEADGLALGLETGPAVDGDGLSGLFTHSTPTIKAAITVAATPAIQYGPRATRASPSVERTRSRRPGEGVPLIWSKAWFSSRRKSSLLTSEHLLDREVGS